MTNAEKYLILFNDIEKFLKKQHTSVDYLPFKKLVIEVAKKSPSVRSHKSDLLALPELRNALVHQYNGEFIAEPHDETIEEIEALYNSLVNPPTAYRISTKNVHICDYDGLIIDTIKIMTKNVYTHIPVYEDKKFMGVFSESTIIRWLSDNAEIDGFILERTKICEVEEYFDKPDDKYNTYIFLSRDKSAYDVRDEFLSSVETQKRLGAVFVTENGRKDEKLLGIITAWDLPKIN